MYIYPGSSDPQQEKPCAICEMCGREIYMTDPIYYVEGRVICPECIEDFAVEYFGCRLTSVGSLIKGGQLK